MIKKYIATLKGQFILLVASLLTVFTLAPATASAACPTLDTSRGTVTSTFSVPATATYRVWARMSSATTNNDSFYMNIDSSVCGVDVGDTSVPTSGWKWVNYKNGSTSTLNDVSLSAGTHTMVMIGKEDSVKVDRILLLSDLNCVPDNATKGENCANPPDTELPTVSMTSPANGATISGTSLLQATATDNVGISKVEFYMGNLLLGTDTASPYTFGLDTTLYTGGSYQLSAIAYDTSGNNQRSSVVNVTIDNGPPPDTTKPVVSISSPLNGSDVYGSVNVSVSATDNVGVTKVEINVDNNLKTTLTQGPYQYSLDTSNLSLGSHSITARAFDAANNVGTATVSVNVVSPPSTTKSADFNNDGTVGIVDLSIMLSNWGKSVSSGTQGDASGDGTVGIVDLSILLSQWGT